MISVCPLNIFFLSILFLLGINPKYKQANRKPKDKQTNPSSRCADNYAFDAFLRGTQQNNSLVLNCQEDSDFSNLDKMCVGYCKVAQHPNTTYEPLIAMVTSFVLFRVLFVWYFSLVFLFIA